VRDGECWLGWGVKDLEFWKCYSEMYGDL
jgi:hypothetical protein